LIPPSIAAMPMDRRLGQTEGLPARWREPLDVLRHRFDPSVKLMEPWSELL
jgi:hypothetical protein